MESSIGSRLLGVMVRCLSLARVTIADDCTNEWQSFPQCVRFQHPVSNQWVNLRDIPLWLNQNAPGNVANHDWGAVTHYFASGQTPSQCDSGRENCRGKDYEWADVEINAEWSVSILIDGAAEATTWTAADAVAYWNWVYEDWTPLTTDLDYSKNSYGFVFDVLDWPGDDVYGVGRLLNEQQIQALSCCWECGIDNAATVAVFNNLRHAIRVTCSICRIEMAPGMYMDMPVIESTREKFRESPLYGRDAECPNSVVIELPKRHTDTGGDADAHRIFRPVANGP